MITSKQLSLYLLSLGIIGLVGGLFWQVDIDKWCDKVTYQYLPLNMRKNNVEPQSSLTKQFKTMFDSPHASPRYNIGM